MAKEIDKSLGDQKTRVGAKPIDSSQRSLGDQSTFGGDGDASIPKRISISTPNYPQVRPIESIDPESGKAIIRG